LVALNLAAWSLFMVNEYDTMMEPLSAFDCILVNMKIEEMDENVANSAVCETINMVIDLSCMQVKSIDHKTNLTISLVRSKRNDRLKLRNHQKFNGEFFNKSVDSEDPKKKKDVTGQFALKWWLKNNKVQPTP